MPKKKKRVSPKKSYPKQPALSPGKRRAFWAALLLLPVLLVLLLELSLRLLGVGDDLALAHRVRENGRDWWEINQNVGRRYFGMQPEFARQAEFARIAFHKPENGLRVICLGGSSMAGFPYNKNATMPGILRTYLRILLPDREIEVVNLGIAAVNSFTVRDLMRDLPALQPDVVLVYAGHNEFYGALGVGSRFSLGSNRHLINLYLGLLRFRTVNLLQQGIGKLAGLFGSRAGPGDEANVMRQMAKQQEILYGSPDFERAAATFAQNLADVVALARRAQIPVLLGDLVANLKDFPPFISKPPKLAADRQAWRRLYSQGERDLANGDFSRAAAALEEAAGIGANSARLQFYLGKCRLAAGDSLAAKAYFSRARDLDLLRFRAPDTFNTIIRQVATAGRTPAVAVQAALERRCAGGIVGAELIAEHLHPNIRGYTALAKVFLQAMNAAGLLPENVAAERIAALPEAPAALGITVLDEEIGRLRIRGLTANWPFQRQIDLSTRTPSDVRPLVDEAATRYIRRQLSWEEAHIGLAEKFSQGKRYDLALAEYRAVLAYVPREFSLYDRIGEVLINQQKHAAALAVLDKSIQLNPTSPYAHASKGKALMFLSKFSAAEAALAKAIELDDRSHSFSPKYRSFILYLHGGALTNLKQFDRAQKLFQEALRVYPENRLAREFLATLQQKMRTSGQ